MVSTDYSRSPLSESYIYGRREIHFWFFLFGLGTGLACNFATLLLIGDPKEFVVKSVAVLFLIAVAIVLRVRTKRCAYQVLIPLLGLVLLAVLSWAFNEAPPFGLLRWFLLTLYIWAVARMIWQPFGPENRAFSLILGLTLAGGAFAVYVVRFSSIPDMMFSVRGSVYTLHPNTQGFICAGTVAMAMALFFLCRNTLYRLVLLAVAAFSVWGLFVSVSRTPMAALIVGITVFILARYGYKSTGRKLVVLVLESAAAAGIVIFILNRYGDLFIDYMRLENFKTTAHRIATWEFVMQEMFYPPMVPFGLGPGIGQLYVMDMMGLSSAHNAILQVVVDLGPLGILPVVLLIVVAGWRAVRTLNRFPVEIAFFSCLVVFSVVRSMAEQELLGLGNSFDLTFPIALVSLWQAPHWCNRKHEAASIGIGH